MSTRAPDRPQTAPSGAAQAPPSPQASRVPRARWLDPRLVLGLLLVLGSVVLGSVVVSRADNTVGVWAVKTDLAAGNTVDADDLVQRQVRLSEGLDAYVSAADAIPDGYVMTRPVSAGELLPRAALGREDATRLRFVSVAIDRAELPAGLARGNAVEVWTAPPGQGQGSAQAGPAQAQRLAERVTVESVSLDDDAFGSGGGTGAVPVVLAVAATDDGQPLEELVAALLEANRARTLYLVGLPAGER